MMGHTQKAEITRMRPIRRSFAVASEETLPLDVVKPLDPGRNESLVRPSKLNTTRLVTALLIREEYCVRQCSILDEDNRRLGARLPNSTHEWLHTLGNVRREHVRQAVDNENAWIELSEEFHHFGPHAPIS